MSSSDDFYGGGGPGDDTLQYHEQALDTSIHSGMSSSSPTRSAGRDEVLPVSSYLDVRQEGATEAVKAYAPLDSRINSTHKDLIAIADSHQAISADLAAAMVRRVVEQGAETRRFEILPGAKARLGRLRAVLPGLPPSRTAAPAPCGDPHHPFPTRETRRQPQGPAFGRDEIRQPKRLLMGSKVPVCRCAAVGAGWAPPASPLRSPPLCTSRPK